MISFLELRRCGAAKALRYEGVSTLQRSGGPPMGPNLPPFDTASPVSGPRGGHPTPSARGGARAAQKRPGDAQPQQALHRQWVQPALSGSLHAMRVRPSYLAPFHK
jgi:hypothetical protein